MSLLLHKYSLLTLTIFVIMVQTKKPSNQRKQIVWRLECELGIISDAECPVDGGWTSWCPWSPCHGPCDDVGHRTRRRECNNPTPSKDGLPCTGLEEQIELCYINNCTVQDYRKLIETDPARYDALRQLDAVPALMERCLQMECPFEAIEAALATDNTWQINPESLWNSLQCVKHNLGCPVVGEWGSWGTWSACGARCGHGQRWRLRRCDTPPPSDSHLICTGTPLQADDCEGDQCAMSSRDTGGSWSEWGQWSSCTENCGAGVRRRRRICNELTTSKGIDTWGTHCRGQHDQLQVCENKVCMLDGRWSGWSAWGPCSQLCGAGKRSRTRSCTRPVPSGRGSTCVGPRIEVASCHIIPCEVYAHTVAVLNGESYLHYDFPNKRSTLFHFYIRFMPVSPHGTLVRRGPAHAPFIRLSLQKWHVCLEASGTVPACSLPRVCSHNSIDTAVWHNALVTVTSEGATLRLDDNHSTIRSIFPCDPDLPNEKMVIYVGERFHGEIQELILNFIPLDMNIERQYRKTHSNFFPSSASNIAYEKASMEEAFLTLENDQYLRLPCFSSQDEWQIELTLKSKREAGTILFMRHELSDSWFHVALQNMRLKLKVSLGDLRTETSSSTECPPDQWLDITISKQAQTNAIEAAVNAGERLHVLLETDIARKRRGLVSDEIETGEMNEENTPKLEPEPALVLCTDEFYVGGVPQNAKHGISDEFTTFSGVIASISVNKELLNLHEYSIERFKDDKVQVSSRTASVSGSYHETAWGKSNHLNLTCIHARTSRSPHTAQWLFLDTSVDGVLRDKALRSVDDGRVLRLVATADNDLRGFYTCRAHANKRTRNIVTYGVLGKIEHRLSGPDTTTAIAVFSTLTLVVMTLAWLIVEGINDLRNGHGFFRDAHWTPEEEAEVVCKFIDQNIHLVGSISAAQVAKARARRRGRQLASKASFAAQEPQGLMQVESNIQDNYSPASEPETLPALPEINSSIEPHQILRCEQGYVSSPRHGSITSPRTGLTTSSSFELASPRFLCSRLLLSKRMNSSRDSSKKSTGRHYVTPRKNRSKLLTIKSSAYINQSPAHKILLKFQQLKGED